MKKLILALTLLASMPSFAWDYNSSNLKQALVTDQGIFLLADYRNDKDSKIEFRSCLVTHQYILRHRMNKLDLLTAIQRKEVTIKCNVDYLNKTDSHDIIQSIEANI